MLKFFYEADIIINQSIYFAIKGHRPLTNHTSSTNITTERKAKLYKLCRYRYYCGISYM